MNEEEVAYVTSNQRKQGLKLPRINYGPVCNMILQEFIVYHRLPKELPLPDRGMKANVLLENILEIMLHSMGDEKRDMLIKQAQEYCDSLPPSLI